MTSPTVPKKRKPSTVRRWIRRAFVAWAVISTLWLANSVRTQGVDPAVLQSSPLVEVADRRNTLEFLPVASERKTALVFICGSGISPDAYAPLLRPIAEEGHPVFVLKLPYRFAPFESHKQLAVDSVVGLTSAHPEYSRWIVSGHSLGAALACRAIQAKPSAFQSMVLVGSTHPKEDDLSYLTIPVTKVYGSNDGVATPESTIDNRALLPAHTRWLEIQGGNHSQFGHYGHQLFDGTASISRMEQQRITREALLKALDDANSVEQTQAPEPAAGPVSNGTSSPPAR